MNIYRFEEQHHTDHSYFIVLWQATNERRDVIHESWRMLWHTEIERTVPTFKRKAT